MKPISLDAGLGKNAITLLVDGKIISNDKEDVANTLYTFFANVTKNLHIWKTLPTYPIQLKQ